MNGLVENDVRFMLIKVKKSKSGKATARIHKSSTQRNIRDEKNNITSMYYLQEGHDGLSSPETMSNTQTKVFES